MDSKAWKSVLGQDAWDHIISGFRNVAGADEQLASNLAAAVLTRAHEVGFIPPTTQPVVSPTGTKVLFPTEDGHGVVPVLTAAGLMQHWRNRGHGFLILRTEQLTQAVAGPLFPWLQAIMTAYEERCAQVPIDPLPMDWRVFVGGQAEEISAATLQHVLHDEAPKPNPSAIKRLHIAGPGVK